MCSPWERSRKATCYYTKIRLDFSSRTIGDSMPVIEATWIFGGPEHGWQERLYFEQSSSDLTQAINTVEFVAGRRAPLLGQQYFIKGTRVKLVSTNGTTFFNGGSRVSRIRRDGFAGQGGAQVDVCLLVSFYNDGSTLRKSMFMGGVWDSIEVDGGIFSRAPSGWQSAWNTWQDTIKTLMGTATQSADGVACAGWLHGGKSIPYSVLGYTSSANNFVTITTAATPFAALVGTRGTIRLSGMDGLNKSVLNGLQAVEFLTASTAKLLRPIACKASPGEVGRVFLYQYGLVKAPTINPEVIRTRERGRPLLVSPGRKPNRART